MGATVVQEFPQTVANTTTMGESLYGLIKGKNLIMYPDADMRSHVLNATGVETARGFRMAKEKATKKIDLAVALAMACCAALQEGMPLTSPGMPTGVGNNGIGADIARTFGSALSPLPSDERRSSAKGGAWLFQTGRAFGTYDDD
jgi:hypothetical protein